MNNALDFYKLFHFTRATMPACIVVLLKQQKKTFLTSSAQLKTHYIESNRVKQINQSGES